MLSPGAMDLPSVSKYTSGMEESMEISVISVPEPSYAASLVFFMVMVMVPSPEDIMVAGSTEAETSAA